MILEEYGIDVEGNTVIKRMIVDIGAEHFHVQFTGEHGIVVPSMVELEH